MIILILVLLTELALAQSLSGQWPPLNHDYAAPHNNYRKSIQFTDSGYSPEHFQTPGFQSQPQSGFGASWQSNYVSPNYNPYINSVKQEQLLSGLTRQQAYNYSSTLMPTFFSAPYAQANFGFYPRTISSLLAPYGSPYTTMLPMSLVPPMLTYNPWFPNYVASPLTIFSAWGY